MLLWPTYTNIGVDDRSQFDLFVAMPGGLSAVKNVVDQLHAHGIKVLLPYNPWDRGTRRGNGVRSISFFPHLFFYILPPEVIKNLNTLIG